ncbi:hypothetical protein PSEUDO8BK_80317 [Pseudomonas sp. 8BK]|nr:hypothetical protein PSEUDO8BK_80317 [Pseudomonas sp. 8BK]
MRSGLFEQLPSLRQIGQDIGLADHLNDCEGHDCLYLNAGMASAYKPYRQTARLHVSRVGITEVSRRVCRN